MMGFSQDGWRVGDTHEEMASASSFDESTQGPVTPRVSVLIATYNHEKYIADALDSALAQDCDFSCELVVAEDHSEDRTRDVVQRYIDRFPDTIRLLPSAENLGIARNYQRAFAACRGRFIAVLEGDDFWISPTKLRDQAAFLTHHPECSFCATHRFVRREDDGRDVGKGDWGTKEPYLVFDIGRLIEGNFIGNFSTCMYRKSIVDRLDPSLYKLPFADWIFNIINAQFGRIGLLTEAMSVYRIHSSGLWAGMTDGERCELLRSAIDSYDVYLDGRYTRHFDVARRRYLS
jgi:glycosyltransferase involved in cell wall biosynthesis